MSEIDEIRYKLKQADEYRGIARKLDQMAAWLRSSNHTGTFLVKVPEHVGITGYKIKTSTLQLDRQQSLALESFLRDQSRSYTRSADGYEAEVVKK